MGLVWEFHNEGDRNDGGNDGEIHGDLLAKAEKRPTVRPDRDD
jgi:hypothetical protein